MSSEWINVVVALGAPPTYSMTLYNRNFSELRSEMRREYHVEFLYLRNVATNLLGCCSACKASSASVTNNVNIIIQKLLSAEFVSRFESYRKMLRPSSTISSTISIEQQEPVHGVVRCPRTYVGKYSIGLHESEHRCALCLQ
jgi:hypothetical protein